MSLTSIFRLCHAPRVQEWIQCYTAKSIEQENPHCQLALDYTVSNGWGQVMRTMNMSNMQQSKKDANEKDVA